MRIFFSYVTAIMLSLPAFAGFKYPESKTVDQQDNFHGTVVKDPYRWLEDDVRNSKDVSDWVEAQNKVTFSYLSNIKERDQIKKRMKTLWDFEKYGTPFIAGNKYFYFKNNGLQNQSVLYFQESLDAKPQLALDPNTWSKDGTVALAQTKVSPNGRYLAYGIQDGGSDWRTWKVKDLKTGKILKDELQWLKFTSVSWDSDSKGFYYSRYPTPAEGQKYQSLNKNQKVYYHRLGNAQKKDRLIYERPDQPAWGFSAEVTDDGNYLLITIWRGTDDRYRLVYFDLKKSRKKPIDLVTEFKYDFSLLGNIDNVFYFRSTQNAPKGKVIAIDLEQPKESDWKTIIPEAEDVLSSASWVGSNIIAHYLKDARSEVKTYSPTGKFVSHVELPGIGSARGFDGSPDKQETFYSFSSFNTPSAVYHYDVKSGKSKLYKKASTAFKPSDYIVKQEFYTSKDGTRVPMFIAHKKDIKPNGQLPTLLYGYGGFNISLTPRFSTSNLAWMEMGGVYVVANLRGGGEYGEAWHKAGTKLQKQNVFDDFIAAAEHLIASKYTNPKKLAIFGGSNGGLLVGASSAQRPDLFAAALPAVGVMDMLRFHKFTAGRFWVDDYGSAEDPQEFKALYAYSPYHNLKSGIQYPATLVTTADTDDRVVPGHSFKYTAALQKAHKGDVPVMIRIETRAGHGSGKPTEKIIEEYADRWAFLLKNLDMTLPKNYP